MGEPATGYAGLLGAAPSNPPAVIRNTPSSIVLQQAQNLWPGIRNTSIVDPRYLGPTVASFGRGIPSGAGVAGALPGRVPTPGVLPRGGFAIPYNLDITDRFDAEGNYTRPGFYDSIGIPGFEVGANALMDSIRSIMGTSDSDSDSGRSDAPPNPYGPGFDEIRRQSQIQAQKGSDLAAMREALQRYSQSQYIAQQSQLKDVRSQYEDAIAKLRDELEGYKGARAGINEAYRAYQSDSDRILSGAIVDTEPLPPSDVVGTVQRSYNEFDGDIQASLANIDSSGNPELAAAMSDEVRSMEGIIVDGMRSGLLSQDERHNYAAAEARALANMAWKDDAYQAERARFGIELQIMEAMQAKQDQIDDQRAAMENALAQARAAFVDTTRTPEQLWALASEEFYKGRGVNEYDRGIINATWDAIMERRPQAKTDYGVFREELLYSKNMELAYELGIGELLEQQIQKQWDESQDETIVNVMRTVDDPERLYLMMSMGGLNTEGLLGFSKDDLIEANSRMVNKYESMYDLWDLHRTFVQDPESFYQVDAGVVLGQELSYNADGTYVYPVAGDSWWSGGGYQGGDGHAGVDIHAAYNTPIVAAVGGIVTRVTNPKQNSVGGYTITITDANGYKHYYAHMNNMTTWQVGQSVPIGAHIGGVGDSGNARVKGTNPHLHYGIRNSNGDPVNPYSGLRETNASIGTKAPNLRDVYWNGGGYQ